jgi:acetyltransferase-like isoleucine patch superfamily enzyme
MKNQVKIILSIIFIIYLKLINTKLYFSKSIIYFSKILVSNSNHFYLNSAIIERCFISVEGEFNQINVEGNLFATKIKIWGKNNQIIIHPNVRLNNSTIILRGNNCRIEIGEGSTFGSINLVCMGTNNYIEIGKNCMFAENIDLWASDSHPVFNDENNLINPSKPIKVGDFVWIGSHCKILKGVSIGNGSIVGMSSIVTKNIEPRTLNVGNPTRTIKSNIRWERKFITS